MPPKSIIKPQADSFTPHPQVALLYALNRYMKSVLATAEYVSKKAYRPHLESYAETATFFSTLVQGELLEAYCKRNRLQAAEALAILERYRNFESLVDAHNEEYVARTMVEEADYLDRILADVDPRILLDEDQRKAVLTDEDYCLIIAGAGAGKTTTVAAKVKYLVEKKGVEPSQILVVSFTNKAVQELRERINGDLEIACPITSTATTASG